jgi:hypothetical protein
MSLTFSYKPLILWTSCISVFFAATGRILCLPRSDFGDSKPGLAPRYVVLSNNKVFIQVSYSTDSSVTTQN